MKIYDLNGKLTEETDSEFEKNNAGEMSLLYIIKDSEIGNVPDIKGRALKQINLDKINFCKVEVHTDYLDGNLCIPDWNNAGQTRRRIHFIIDRSKIIFVDNDAFIKKVMTEVIRRFDGEKLSREKIIAAIFEEILRKDIDILNGKEQSLEKLEDSVENGVSKDVQKNIWKIRKQMIIFREYYQEIDDLFEILKVNETGIFSESETGAFGIIEGRAERLTGKTDYLIEYLSYIKDMYVGAKNDVQNSNMNYLTVISTIFLPLTLITGWFGMNFSNMPELENGYPFVIVASIVIVAVVVIIFKKKRFF